jgi:transposase-like protein
MDLVSYTIDKIYEYGFAVSKHFDKINFRCPFCGDSKQSRSKARGWYYTKTQSFYCWNCGENANSIKLLAQLEGVDIKEIKKRLILNKTINIKQSKPTRIDKPTVHQHNQEIMLPSNWVDYTTNEAALNVVTARKILDAPFIPKRWQPYYCTYTKRLVLPWLRDNKIVYYQLRKLYKQQEPKYLFPKDTNKELFVINLDANFRYLFLHEGILDSLFCKNSACIGGVNLSDLQKQELDKYILEGYEPIWLLDNQWEDETSRKVTIKLLTMGHKVFIWDKDVKVKDINEYVIKYGENPFVDEDYLCSHIYDNLKGKLKLKFGM